MEMKVVITAPAYTCLKCSEFQALFQVILHQWENPPRILEVVILFLLEVKLFGQGQTVRHNDSPQKFYM